MGITAVLPSEIISVPALSILGNSTGSTGSAESLNSTQVRTILGLGTTDTPQWAGATLTGDLLFSANNTYDVGNGTYNPRTVRAATSVLTPLLNNTNAAALIVGNSTYGISVPGNATISGGRIYGSHPACFIDLYNPSTGQLVIEGNSNQGSPYGDVVIRTSATDRVRVSATTGAATFSGDISMSKTSAQGYIRAYATDGVKNAALYHDGTNGRISTSSGYLGFQPINGNTVLATSAVQSRLYVYDSTLAKSAILTHDGTTGILTTDTGNGSMKVTSSGGNTILSAPTGYVLAVSPVDGVTNFAVTGTQSKARVYNSVTDQYSELTHDGTNGILSTSSGRLILTGGYTALSPTTGISFCYTNGLNSEFWVYGVSGAKSTNISHNDTNGFLSTSSGALVLTAATSIIGIGGITSAYPAIKRSGTTAAFRLGDDSADAPISCAGITASGNVSYAQGLSTGTVTKSANYTTTADDYCVNVTANSIDITFETAVGCANREHEVINSGSGVVTLKTTSAQTISGNASGALTLAQWKSIRVKSDGSNWLIMSQVT